MEILKRGLSVLRDNPREVMFSLLGLCALAIVVLYLCGKVPLSYNLRNLTVRWKTSLLTGLAFTLVVSLLTVMLAFVNGMYRLTATSGQPGNVIILAEGSTDESFSSLQVSDVGDIALQPGVLTEDGTPLCSGETYFVINQPYRVRLRGRSRGRFVQLRGVDDPAISGRVHGLALEAGGNWFSGAGIRAARNENERPLLEAVVGEGLAGELGRDRPAEELAVAKNKNRLEVGDTFPLRGREWVVTGIIKASGSTFDSEVWAKRSIIGEEFGKTNYTSIVVRAKDAAAAVGLREYFNNDFKKAALLAQVETDYFASLSQTSQQFLIAVVFLAVFMAVGGVGVTNTMFAAISQRTKDIGVLRLIGYSRQQVLISFLLESLLIALAGGLLGCAIGFLFDGWSVSSVVGSGQPGGSKFVVLKMSVDANVLAGGVLLTLFMGFLGGLIPALSAVRLKPLESLR